MASQSPKKVFISIAGNIGSGKSSLTKLLSRHFGWIPFYESVEDNPYLSDFYRDMKRWSFHLQVYFLSNRFKNHKKIIEMPESVVQDRSIYEDVEIFARNLHEMGNMDRRDYENYRELFNIMVDYLKPPDLLIYLRANVNTLMKQIKLRGREYEQSIKKEYLERLNSSYEEWITKYNTRSEHSSEGIRNLLIIESDEIDFVNNTGHLDDIIRKVEAAIGNHGSAFRNTPASQLNADT
ncbi:MAG TPA: deoxynucleoside kinase [Candidatus Acidoferrales bacterium]|nr:deoxynucleoside kinase [Candidatus Acidoferrales bacterium]